MKALFGCLLICAATCLTACGSNESAESADATVDAREQRGNQCEREFIEEYREVDSLVAETVNDIRNDKGRRGGNDRNERRIDDSVVTQTRSNAESWLFLNGSANCLEVSFACTDEDLSYDQCPQEKRKVTMKKVNFARLKQGLEEINSYLDR